jgi:hypothetical protein
VPRQEQQKLGRGIRGAFMNRSMRIFFTLAMAAVMPLAAHASAADKGAKTGSRATSVTDEPDVLDEPVLPTPTKAQRANAAKSASSAARSAASPKAATTASRSAAKPVTKARTEPKMVSAAAFEEPTPADEIIAPPAHPVRKSTVSAAPTRVRSYEEAAPFAGPDPGYHPARVNRKQGGWTQASMQPAGPAEIVPSPEVMDDSASFTPYSDGGDLAYDGDEMFGSYGMPGRRYAFLAGGEGLLIRPHFSQSAALTTTSSDTSTATTVFDQTITNFNPGYQGAFRTYLGIRNCVCGDELRFTFLNYNGAENLSGTATQNTSVCDFLCNTTPNPGDRVSTHFGMGMSLWDIDCIRPFFCVPPSCDPCGPQCHPWDLRWFAGMRFAYINHNISSTVTDNASEGGIFAQATASNKFTGFGPRMGLQGRKYFGQKGRLSVYGRGSGSLLVGNVYQDVTNSTPSGEIPTTANLLSRNSRIIPVAELELGATWWMLPRFAVSGGWLLMSFWDLGMQETGTLGATPNLDDSNILGFDGFFVRGELVF